MVYKRCKFQSNQQNPRVRWRQGNKEPMVAPPQTQDPSQIASLDPDDSSQASEATEMSVSEERFREEWSRADNNIIETRIFQERRCPPKKEIFSIFQETDALRDIWERKGPRRCYDKVKNSFKKKAQLKRLR